MDWVNNQGLKQEKDIKRSAVYKTRKNVENRIFSDKADLPTKLRFSGIIQKTVCEKIKPGRWPGVQCRIL